jgi:hypothetical protein
MRVREKALSCAALAALWAGSVTSGCSNNAGGGAPPSMADSVPTLPILSVGMAALSGHVRSQDGSAVAGATVQVAETDATTMTDADGAYRLEVQSDSTVTLMATATGLAPTFRESVVIAAKATITDFDLLLLPPDRIAAINALGAPGQEATRGIMAVRLHSMDPACNIVGAQVSVWPPMGAKVIYAPADVAGGIAAPDPGVTAVAAGADIDLWLAGAFPPANGLVFTIEQPGCQLMVASPSLGGLTFPGLRHVAAAAMTQVDLFLEATP